ncbi:hypothetical protein ACFLWA_04690 [Chloroflexota bacterium]
METTIRPLATTEEYHACERLQQQVWRMTDDLDVVPLHLLVGMQHNGGLLLGAFHGDTLVGFVLGYPGLTVDGFPQHCSHMMGILPEFQNQSLGYSLKVAQREHAGVQGHELVTWTYDPLESRNAYLNVRKLGAVCDTYLRDYYGPMTDGLNAGLPSDRFEVNWWIAGERVARRLHGGRTEALPHHEGAPLANETRVSAGVRVPSSMNLELDAPVVRIEIPTAYQAIKAGEPRLALEWRTATRQLFESYFAAGYQVIDLDSRPVGGQRRSFYVLKLR